MRSPLDALPTPAPPSVRFSLGAWLASCIFPLIAVTYALSRMSDVRAHQRAIALAETPDSTATSLDRVVNVTVWIALAAMILPVIIEVVFAILMVKRVAWARIGLLAIGVLAVPASLIAVDALSDDQAVTNRTWVVVGVGIQALLALIGAILMYRREANVWFNTRPKPTPVTTPYPELANRKGPAPAADRPTPVAGKPTSPPTKPDRT